MKRMAIVLGYLLWVGLPLGRCAVVEVLDLKPSSQHVRIRVLQDSKPVPNVAIVVSGVADGQPHFSVVTDSHGAAKLPTLLPGNYCIEASASPTLRADLCLAVSRRFGGKTSSFSMDLLVKPPLPPTLEESVETTENAPVTARLQEFRGVVVDPSGTGISGTVIQIFHKGSRGHGQVAKTTSEPDGHFAVHLPMGAYTAVIQFFGFDTRILTFEIAENGDAKDLRIGLDLAPST
jgi:hypothetical protein